MKFHFIFLPAVFICLCFSNGFAQPELWEIYTFSEHPYINVTVEKYENDSLYMKFMEQTFVLHQDSIKYIKQRRDSKSGIGALFGAVAGGFLFSSMTNGGQSPFAEIGNFTSIIAGVLLGGLVGGIAGSTAGTDKKYNLEDYDNEKKRDLLDRLFNKQQSKVTVIENEYQQKYLTSYW